ncbi:MAG: hypothetical protein IJI41_11465 [Anaerolineaceae bacterium]|nr:hypothetical protein [Anaerolineaceae bacterium]MBR6088417.1 hypothetical protein [Anaerolineaceae bacterium]
MEIKSLEYKLKYGPIEFLLDTLPPGLLVFLNGKIIEACMSRIQQAYEPVRKFGISLLISAGIVFGSVFLYEIIEAIITGRNRKVRVDHCMDSFLVSFGCRFHYFRKNDVKGFNFDGKRKKLTVTLTRCLEKRRGIYSYIRLFTGTYTQHREKSVSEYIAPLTAGGPDLIRFGEPDNSRGGFFNPFRWTPVTQIQMIEKDSDFEFSIPCRDKTAAGKIISEIIGYEGFGRMLEAL